jgi:hypothetical protein
MNRKKFLLFYQLAALIVFICSCAKISSPTGGPKDKLPPVVIKSIPENGAKNFKGKKLSVTFNEYVKLDNINDKFMVSPPMKKKPKVFLKGKSVIVEFDEAIKDSTTYTFYFQDAVRDLNEGNILENFRFVFSTGAVIDSLSVTGNVYSSFSLEAPEKTQVILYRELADSAVVKHIPDYISRVDQTGYFRIDNVREGNYRLYALKDNDNSKNYNSPDEELAFMNSPVVISPGKNFIPEVKDTTTVKKRKIKVSEKETKKGEIKVPEPVILKGEYQLILFAATKKLHYFKSSNRDLKYHMIYALSLPPGNMNFTFSIPDAESNTYLLERSRNNDTLKVWLRDSSLYAQPLIKTIVNYPFTDSLGVLGYREDTIMMRFLTPRAPRVAKVRKPKFIVESNITSGSLKPEQSIVFYSKTPFRQPDTSRIRLYEISDQKRNIVPYTLIKDSTNVCRYVLNSTLLQKKKYLLVAESQAFSNIFNEYSDSSGIKFIIKDSESFSKLTLNITNYEGDRIIQLLNNTEKLVKEVQMKKDGILVFPLLENGFYRLRVIYDLNGDGKWTTGDFTKGQQPEPVSYYPDEIEMKPDRYIEQDWDIGMQNLKDQKLREKKKSKS